MPHLEDAKYWRKRAQEARAIADNPVDRGAKYLEQEIARGYELLAKFSEQDASPSQGKHAKH